MSDEVRFLGYSLFSRSIKADCGHKARSKGTILVYGQEKKFHLPWRDKSVEFCLECQAKMMTRCAWCGRGIMVGDPITMYEPLNIMYQAPVGSRAYVFNQEKQELAEVDPKTNRNIFSYVGCLGWNCASTGADRFGFWVAPGRPAKAMSPMEAMLLTGNTVIVSDLGDINEALQLEYETRKRVLVVGKE